MNEDDNIFDEDDALDYIMQEEVDKGNEPHQEKSGCLGFLLLLVLPVGLLGLKMIGN